MFFLVFCLSVVNHDLVFMAYSDVLNLLFYWDLVYRLYCCCSYCIFRRDSTLSVYFDLVSGETLPPWISGGGGY